MSSTDKSAPDAATKKALEKFWTDRVVPAAEALRSRGVQFFALRPDSAAPSYYSTPDRSAEPFFTLQPEQWELLLRQMWQQQGLPELVDLAGPLVQLAQKLKLPEEQRADVSPFIYVMF